MAARVRKGLCFGNQRKVQVSKDELLVRSLGCAQDPAVWTYDG